MQGKGHQKNARPTERSSGHPLPGEASRDGLGYAEGRPRIVMYWSAVG